MELPAINQPVQRWHLTQSTKAKVTDLASIPHRFAALEHPFGSEHIFRHQTETLRHSTLQRDSSVKLDEVNVISIESFESRFDRPDRSGSDIADGIGV